MKNLNLVIDTNIFLVSIAKNFRYRWIYDALLNGKFNLLISTEILLEYEELFQIKYGVKYSSDKFVEFLLNKNVLLISPSFRWQTIYTDLDDNKFVDCAIAGNADFIISNDADFKILKTIDFPKVNVLTLDEFETSFKEYFIS